jgi:oxazoline/thiazoline synthase
MHNIRLDLAISHWRTISVHQIGNAKADALVAYLNVLGFRLVDSSGDFEICVADDYLRDELQVVNGLAMSRGRPWMLTKIVGSIVWIGPVFAPPQTACYACLAQRLAANRQVESFLRTVDPAMAPTPPCFVFDPITQLATKLVAREIINSAATELSSATTGVLTFDAISSTLRFHQLFRRPQCRVCGNHAVWISGRQPRPPMIRSTVQKTHAVEANHRTATPEETLGKYRVHISPITGVVNDVSRVEGDSSGLTVTFTAAHNFAVVGNDVLALRQNLRGRAGGKGVTETQSEVSAICEALERYSGVFRAEEEISVRATYRDLGRVAIRPQECLLFSRSQYANRHAWNKSQEYTRFHLVPNPFDEGAQISWTPLWSLTEERFYYLPTSYCYYGHPDLLRFGFCGADSNGCAAGNSIEEAIIEGFCELVERDSVALWWYNKLKRPLVDIATFPATDFVGQITNLYRQLRRRLWVIDITSDTGIPAFAAVSANADRRPEDIIIGYGAHLDPNAALLRALTELSQFLPMVSSSDSKGYRATTPDMVTWFASSTLENQPYLVPDHSSQPRQFGDFLQRSGSDLSKDIQICIGIVRNMGLNMMCLEQTRPDIGMPVCRIVVPGLRHFWRRLGPGRLYDVPVKQGWIKAPLVEEQLNSVSMFF